MNYDLPVRSALSELGITRTKKAILDLDSGTFNEENETYSFTRGAETTTLEVDAEFGRVKLAGLFGIGKGYAKKMPWDLFVTNILHWANEGRVMLEWTEDEDSEYGLINRAVSAEKTVLNRDSLLSELFGFTESYALPDEYRLRSLSSDRDTLYLDFQVDGILGVRLVADVSLKKGLKTYGLVNTSEDNWAPYVVTNFRKVRTRGKDELEVYESIRKTILDEANDLPETYKMVSTGMEGQHFTYDYHLRDSLVALATSKAYGVNSKMIGYLWPSPEGHDTYLPAFLNQAVDQLLDGWKPAEIHAYQSFVGNIARLPSLVHKCSFCYSTLEEEEE